MTTNREGRSPRGRGVRACGGAGGDGLEVVPFRSTAGRALPALGAWEPEGAMRQTRQRSRFTLAPREERYDRQESGQSCHSDPDMYHRGYTGYTGSEYSDCLDRMSGRASQAIPQAVLRRQ